MIGPFRPAYRFVMRRPYSVLFLPMLLACSQPAPREPSPRRVIIEFERPGAVTDPHLADQLSRTASLPVEYAAAISSRSAAYLLHCSAADPHCVQAIARLAEHAGVLRIELDRREKIR